MVDNISSMDKAILLSIIQFETLTYFYFPRYFKANTNK